MKSTTAALFALAVATFVIPACAFAEEQWIIKESPHTVAVTADKLVAAIENAGPKVFARIDHEANAKGAGLEVEPTTVILFGNPKIGTPIMKANRKAAIDLPVKVLIWSEGGKTMLGAVSPETLVARYGLKGAEEPLKKMGGALNKLMGAATQ